MRNVHTGKVIWCVNMTSIAVFEMALQVQKLDLTG